MRPMSNSGIGLFLCLYRCSKDRGECDKSLHIFLPQKNKSEEQRLNVRIGAKKQTNKAQNQSCLKPRSARNKPKQYYPYSRKALKSNKKGPLGASILSLYPKLSQKPENEKDKTVSGDRKGGNRIFYVFLQIAKGV